MPTMQYLGFDVSSKARVSVCGGSPIANQKLKLFNKTNYTFRILLWENFEDLYSTANTDFKIKIREKRQSSSDLLLIDTTDFLYSLWTTTEAISLVYVYDLEGGVFKPGDKLYGANSEARGTVIDFSEESGALVYKPTVVGQYFEYQEFLQVTKGEVGFTGVQARLGLEEVVLSYSPGEGMIACECEIDASAIDTLLASREYADLILELTELDGEANSTILGQCEIKLINSFS